MKQAENAWMYEKYTADVIRARNLLDLILNSDDPRYLRNTPEHLFDVTKRIAENKLKRAEAYKLDFYFDE